MTLWDQIRIFFLGHFASSVDLKFTSKAEKYSMSNMSAEAEQVRINPQLRGKDGDFDGGCSGLLRPSEMKA